jgi:hypothetical protein
MGKKKNKKTSGKHATALAILQELDTKGDPKNSLIESVKSLVVGVVGGGLAGAAIGKPSLAVGFATSLTGNFLKQPLLTTLGMGMMASGGYQIGTGLKGTDGLDGAKDRMKSFGQNLKQRLYLDKIIKPKSGTDGVGEVQYFKYPQKEIDMGSLDNLEQQIAESSERFQASRQIAGAEDDVSGTEENIAGAEDDVSGTEEYVSGLNDEKIY